MFYRMRHRNGQLLKPARDGKYTFKVRGVFAHGWSSPCKYSVCINCYFLIARYSTVRIHVLVNASIRLILYSETLANKTEEMF